MIVEDFTGDSDFIDLFNGEIIQFAFSTSSYRCVTV